MILMTPLVHHESKNADPKLAPIGQLRSKSTCRHQIVPTCPNKDVAILPDVATSSPYTPQIVYKVVICPRGVLPYIQITSIVLSYSQFTKYLEGAYLSWRKSTLYPDHLYSAIL